MPGSKNILPTVGKDADERHEYDSADDGYRHGRDESLREILWY